MTTSLEELAERVTVLEKAQITNASTMKWMAGTLGQIQAAVDDHTVRLDGIDKRLDRVEHEIKGLRADMPGIVAAALRDVLKPS